MQAWGWLTREAPTTDVFWRLAQEERGRTLPFRSGRRSRWSLACASRLWRRGSIRQSLGGFQSITRVKIARAVDGDIYLAYLSGPLVHHLRQPRTRGIRHIPHTMVKRRGGVLVDDVSYRGRGIYSQSAVGPDTAECADQDGFGLPGPEALLAYFRLPCPPLS